MTQLFDDNFIVIQYPVDIKFSTSLELHCGYINGFSRSKNKNKRLAIQEQIEESYSAVQANLLVSELFFIACHYSDKPQFGLESRPKIYK